MLQKSPININFSKGLDTKTDPKQIEVGKFLSLVNTIFDNGGLLQKRNGYGALSALPNNTYQYLTTFNGNLTAIGSAIAAYSSGSSSWVSKGTYTPLELSTLPLIRNSLNQTQTDSVIAPNGLVCTTYTETNGSTVHIKFAIADSVTGQNIVAPQNIPVSSGTPTGSSRVFLLGPYFIIIFTNVISGISHLQYVAISYNSPTLIGANTDIASSYVPKTTVSWDAYVVNTNLYIAYNTTTGGQSVKVTYLTVQLVLVSAVTFGSRIATMMSVTADNTTPANPIIWVSFYDLASSTGYTLAVDKNLNTILAPQETIGSGTNLNLTIAAQNGVCSLFIEAENAYSYDGSISTNLIDRIDITQAGTITPLGAVVRSVGLASKAFIVDGTMYFLAAYQSPYQPSYFLINGSTSTQANPQIVSQLAYSNGGGYLTTGLPSVTVMNGVASVSYLIKDLIQAVNKNINPPTGSQIAGIYSQTGISLANFDFDTNSIFTSEIGQGLQFGGGLGYTYDGYYPTENSFFLYPDSVELTAHNGSGGAMIAQQYYYQAIYQYNDNQGNPYFSAPSIPVKVTLTSSGSCVTVNVPYYRLTYKTANLAKVVIYRWSEAQQSMYQVTSISTPLLNDTTQDSIAFVDTLADASILGNALLYTTGGAVEDTAPPAYHLSTLADSRQWVVDDEDRNTLWFSKTVIPGTSVEFSDLLTMAIPPSTGSEGSTGPMTALSVMDTKLIIFKENAIYYVETSAGGPDNTGANSQYGQPQFITSTVGCTNQNSIVFTPAGLMFQSNKGIWLLDRNLGTDYIGAPVQAFTTNATVQSAVSIPKTNQIRFTLDTGITLMYDYYYGQWGTFKNVPAISSCIYQDLHTYIDKYGATYQETPGSYLDGSTPVLISFVTGWIHLAGITGYQRIYDFYLTGQYISPHFLSLQIGYDYGYPSQQSIIQPDNYSGPYGTDQYFGQTTPFAGPGSLEQWRIHTEEQTCQAFQIGLQEIFNPAFGSKAGAGFTLSGLLAQVGVKKGARPIKASNSVG